MMIEGCENYMYYDFEERNVQKVIFLLYRIIYVLSLAL